MPWLKLPQEFDQRPEAGQVGREAMWLHVAGLLYCSRLLTDGRVPAGAIYGLAMGPDAVELVGKLVDAGLWEVDTGGGYYIPEYLSCNPTRAHYEEVRAKRSAVGREGGVASGAARRAPNQNAKQIASGDEANGKQIGPAIEANGKQIASGLNQNANQIASVVAGGANQSGKQSANQIASAGPVEANWLANWQANGEPRTPYPVVGLPGSLPVVVPTPEPDQHPPPVADPSRERERLDPLRALDEERRKRHARLMRPPQPVRTAAEGEIVKELQEIEGFPRDEGSDTTAALRAIQAKVPGADLLAAARTYRAARRSKDPTWENFGRWAKKKEGEHGQSGDAEPGGSDALLPRSG